MDAGCCAGVLASAHVEPVESGGGKMTWLWHLLQRYRRYRKQALWIVPFNAIILELIAYRLVHALDDSLGWQLQRFSAAGAQALLETVITMTLSFLVFTFGSLLVAIQIAGGQLTPRVIATTLLRDNIVRYTVGLFVFSLLFAISALNRIEGTGDQLVLLVAGALGLLSIAAFLFLIDYAARLLRPVSILSRVGESGLTVIDAVYPQLIQEPSPPHIRPQIARKPVRIICHTGPSEVVLSVNTEILLDESQKADAVVQVIPVVGDFVGKDEPLFALYGNVSGIDDNILASSINFGIERTLEQDPTFAFRIVLDIALKALSPAINDPTTAVLAIDQLHRLLRSVGKRHLRADSIVDESGKLRVIFRTPNWEDFVTLACTELRRYGSDSIQVVRRLRAMIENLILTLPEDRHAALQAQVSLLDHAIRAIYITPEELVLARTTDTQGLGGTPI
jgi:uncharacterized membrane protein